MDALSLAWVSDPSIWLGLLTLIVLEIVLGVDNLVFIAILADKLPPEQRDRARVIGLTLALLMRLGLLSIVSWLVTLTTPLFSIGTLEFSGRALILLVGGLFLLFKATTELHERLEGVSHTHNGPRVWASFSVVVTQIVLLDAVFSLDSVITAVGMVGQIWIMVAAVVAAVLVMMVFADTVSRFVHRHPTIQMLALSFLILIGVFLVAEGLGKHIDRGYIYFAMFFSLLVEFLNMRMRKTQAS